MFQAFWAAFTFILAVSKVNGGSGGFEVDGGVEVDIFVFFLVEVGGF